METFQPIHISRSQVSQNPQQKPSPKARLSRWWIFAGVIGILLGYFFLPLRTNILILGVDGGLSRGELGRTDTIILTTISPTVPYVGLLSIPRDLWVNIPGVGENRINTAYFFAEAQTPGSGTSAARETIWQNFGVRADYSVVLRMDGLIGLVDALDGLDVNLPAPMSGYDSGTYHFDGEQALAFARSRAGSDDFARMKQGQILAQAAVKKIINPSTWPRFSEIYAALPEFIETNIPVWQWPRLGLALLRAGLSGIDARTITREMVNPFTTNAGAQVLGPNWEKIEPVLKEMFGK